MLPNSPVPKSTMRTVEMTNSHCKSAPITVCDAVFGRRNTTKKPRGKQPHPHCKSAITTVCGTVCCRAEDPKKSLLLQRHIHTATESSPPCVPCIAGGKQPKSSTVLKMKTTPRKTLKMTMTEMMVLCQKEEGERGGGPVRGARSSPKIIPTMYPRGSDDVVRVEERKVDR